MAKLSIPGQKENLDPSKAKKSLNRRRGSAHVAVALPPKTTTEESVSLLIRTCDKFMRRGSMPADVIHLPANDKQLENFFYSGLRTCHRFNVVAQFHAITYQCIEIAVMEKLAIGRRYYDGGRQVAPKSLVLF